MADQKLVAEVSQYYSGRYREFGATARGVDWNGPESQEPRFRQFLNLLPKEQEFSLNDLGCGYGALHSFLLAEKYMHRYQGVDVVFEMIEMAKNHYPESSFVHGSKLQAVADYSVASGVLNVKGSQPIDVWWDYVQQTIRQLAEHSSKGFAFNCLTSYSDAPKRSDHLFYAEPGEILDLCCRNYSRTLTLLHGYGLYEFTVLVDKTGIPPLVE